MRLLRLLLRALITWVAMFAAMVAAPFESTSIASLTGYLLLVYGVGGITLGLVLPEEEGARTRWLILGVPAVVDFVVFVSYPVWTEVSTAALWWNRPETRGYRLTHAATMLLHIFPVAGAYVLGVALAGVSQRRLRRFFSTRTSGKPEVRVPAEPPTERMPSPMSKRLSKLPAIAAKCVLGIALLFLLTLPLTPARDLVHPFGLMGAYLERSLSEQDNRLLYMRKLTARDRSEFGELRFQNHILWWGVAEPCPDAVEAHRAVVLVTKGESLPRMTVILWMSREGTVFRTAVVSRQKTKPPEWLTEFAQQSLGKKRLEVPSLLQRRGLWTLANSADWLNSGRLRRGASLKLCEGADIFGYWRLHPGVYVLLDAKGKVLEAVLFRS